MFSIIIATIGYILLGLVFILDKYILTDTSVKNPAVYTFYSTAFMLGALFFIPFTSQTLYGIDWVWALISGISFGFALWSMFLAMHYGEATHINPFIGAITSVGIYSIAHFSLQEELTLYQTIGIAILIAATLLFSFEKSKKYKGFHVGFIWGIASGIFYAISHVTAKYIYTQYDFLTGFIWTRATTALVAILVFFSPAMIKHFKKTYLKKRKRKKKKKSYKLIGLITIDKILAILAVIFIQFAISNGSVSIVGGLAGIQYVFMFFAVYLLSKYWPQIFKEYFTKKEIQLQITALVLVLIGYIFLVL